MGYEVIIFPARVGMNRAGGLSTCSTLRHFPRASGDEPLYITTSI